jgi:hypothetical protein
MWPETGRDVPACSDRCGEIHSHFRMILRIAMHELPGFPWALFSRVLGIGRKAGRKGFVQKGSCI